MTPKSPETKSRGLENMTGRPRVVMDVGTERMDASERTKLQKTEGTLTTSKNKMNVTKEAIFINLPKFFLSLQPSGGVNGTIDVYLKWRYTYLPASAKPRAAPQVCTSFRSREVCFKYQLKLFACLWIQNMNPLHYAWTPEHDVNYLGKIWVE